MIAGSQGLYEGATKSLERMQSFDATSLERDQLGPFNFKDAVAPAQRLIDLYGRVPVATLDDFPDAILGTIQSLADADFNRLDQMITFDPTANANPNQLRTNLIKELASSYPGTFSSMYPLVAYAASKAGDFTRLETEGRATLQGVKDEARGLTDELRKRKTEADGVLAEIRKVAAEEGVSQEALFFNAQANIHQADAKTWGRRTTSWAVALIVVAVGTLFLHKWDFLAPQNSFQMIQLGISKVLIFAVLSFMLYLSARNYLASRHNEIVNRHRQTALQTFKALAEAAKEPASRDIVLSYAASCIFSPQPTGFSEGGLPKSPTATSLVEIIGKSGVGGVTS